MTFMCIHCLVSTSQLEFTIGSFYWCVSKVQVLEWESFPRMRPQMSALGLGQVLLPPATLGSLDE